MITCYLMGGLGNQLFQIFTTVHYAIKHRMQFKFHNVEHLGGGPNTTLRHTYWKSLLDRFKPFLLYELPENMVTLRERGFEFNEIIIEPHKGDDIILFGYFQSYKYFEKSFPMICKILNLVSKKDEACEFAGLSCDFYQTTSSLHFRMGDYKKLTDFHPIMSIQYYEKAIRYIMNCDESISNILFFCEDDDYEDVMEKVNELKQKFPTLNFLRGKHTLDDWQQMLIMSLCKHNIIANSSFSWWGAYFNENPEKIVCYPSLWFGEKAVGKNTKDLFPSSWKKIKV